jgi:hypothetical protein
MKKISLLLLLVMLPGRLFTQSTLNPGTTPFALTHVTVIDATEAPAKPDMTVVIAGDRISEIGKTGQVRIPEGAQVVNAAGKFLIPGLWDMDVLATYTVFPFYVVTGVTGVRDIGSPRPIAALLDLRKSTTEGRVVAPRIVATGRPLDGPFPGRPHHTPVAIAMRRVFP